MGKIIFFTKNYMAILMLTAVFISNTALASTAPYTEEFLHAVSQLDDNESSTSELIDAIKVISEHKTLRGYNAIVRKIEDLISGNIDVERFEIHSDRVAISVALSEYLRDHSKPEDFKLYLKFMKWMARYRILTESNKEQFVEIGKRIKDSKEPFIYTDAAEEQRAALSKLREAEEWMKNRIINQNEIIDAFSGVMTSDAVSGDFRSKPELFYLTGLGGKMHLVKTFVDAMHLHEGAHEDHLFVASPKNDQDLNTLLGSGRGYIGSDKMTGFIKFLINHSNGRYYIETVIGSSGKKEEIVYENPNWRDKVISPSALPSKAVIVAKDIDLTPKNIKDDFWLNAMDGVFTLGNAGAGEGAVSQIRVPINIIFTSTNDTASLLEPRDSSGRRYGAPLSFDELIANYRIVSEDKDRIKTEIISGGGQSSGQTNKGTSVDWVNKIPNHRVLMPKPLNQDHLAMIAELEAQRRSLEFINARGVLGSYEISLSNDLIKFIADYDHIPSNYASEIPGKLESFVYKLIMQAIKSGKIRALGRRQDIFIDTHQYLNGAVAVVFKVKDPESGDSYQFSRLIAETLKDIPKKPMSDERFNEVKNMGNIITKNAFGVEHIVEELVSAALMIEEEAADPKKPSKAKVFAFLGKSSTGKTELAKQFAVARHGKSTPFNLIDFNKVKTVEDLKDKILGSKDPYGSVILSDFMKMYDRSNGTVTIVLDEIANAGPEALKALYDILREPVATGFSDGKERPMKNVVLIMTGNAGEEIYKPLQEESMNADREKAMREIFKIFSQDSSMQQKVLLKTFTEAFLARINRIFHFGPLSDVAKRQLSQLKLLQALKAAKPEPHKRGGWDIGFQTEVDFLSLLQIIENEGYSPDKQGASIDDFVKNKLINRFYSALLTAQVPKGSSVFIKVNSDPIVKSINYTDYSYREIELVTDNKKIKIEIPVGLSKHKIKISADDLTLTAYHEVGHLITSQVYLGDLRVPSMISVVPGVAKIGSDIVSYAGIARSEVSAKRPDTKNLILREVANLLGGTVAQELISINNVNDAGKANDIKRATRLIHKAILIAGLSEEWGLASQASDTELERYIAGLSEQQKNKLHQITLKWIADARELAEMALYVNSPLLIKASKKLAEKGILDGDDITNLFAETPPVVERNVQEYDQAIVNIKAVRDVLNLGHEGLSSQQINDLFSMPVDGEIEFEKVYELLLENSRSQDKGLKWSNLTSEQQFVAESYITQKIQNFTRDAQISKRLWLPEATIDPATVEESSIRDEVLPVTDKTKFTIDSMSLTCKSLLN